MYVIEWQRESDAEIPWRWLFAAALGKIRQGDFSYISDWDKYEVMIFAIDADVIRRLFIPISQIDYVIAQAIPRTN
jgi:hypothetical protein